MVLKWGCVLKQGQKLVKVSASVCACFIRALRPIVSSSVFLSLSLSTEQSWSIGWGCGTGSPGQPCAMQQQCRLRLLPGLVPVLAHLPQLSATEHHIWPHPVALAAHPTEDQAPSVCHSGVLWCTAKASPYWASDEWNGLREGSAAHAGHGHQDPRVTGWSTWSSLQSLAHLECCPNSWSLYQYALIITWFHLPNELSLGYSECDPSSCSLYHYIIFITWFNLPNELSLGYSRTEMSCSTRSLRIPSKSVIWYWSYAVSYQSRSPLTWWYCVQSLPLITSLWGWSPWLIPLISVLIFAADSHWDLLWWLPSDISRQPATDRHPREWQHLCNPNSAPSDRGQQADGGKRAPDAGSAQQARCGRPRTQVSTGLGCWTHFQAHPCMLFS